MTDVPQTTDTPTDQDHNGGSATTEPNGSVNSDQDAEEVSHESMTNNEDGDTFPRSYVEKLRDENANYRQRAQRSDELAHRLHRALVEADGRLADPTDLEFTDDHLEDSEALTAAVDELLATKPHLAARKPAGDIGQGASGGNSNSVDLAGLLRAGAN